MKENRYDDPAFFEQYSKMSRSVEGLNAAGEWYELQKLLPDFSKKRVLDLGCGYGWHCIYAAEQGASKVIGSDISAKMLEVAKSKTKYSNVEYIQSAMESLVFSPASFDLVISSLAFHYVKDYTEMLSKIYHWLSPGGDFVFSVEHPVFTAYGSQAWYDDEYGKHLHWPLDHYFNEGKRNAIFLGENVTKYHRTLTSYLSGLISSGFSIQAIVEPQPSPEMLQNIPEMIDELRRPMMLLISAKKI